MRRPADSDLDIYRTAALFVKQHGDKAPIHAAMRADELSEAGNMESRAAWQRVLEAAKVLQATELTGAVH